MLREVMQEPGFRLYVALLHEPYHSPKWHNDHPNIDFWKLEKGVTDELAKLLLTDKPFTSALPEAIVLLTLPLYIDAKVTNQENLQWIFRLSKAHNRLPLVIPALLTAAAADPNYVSTKEIAEATGMSESPWRVKCQNGELPGAKLVGGNWIIPEYTLIRMGLRE